MAKHHEGSAKDKREDARGAKSLGVSKSEYENTARDKREDRAGEHGKKKPPQHKHRAPKPPMAQTITPGQIPGMSNDNFGGGGGAMPPDDDLGME